MSTVGEISPQTEGTKIVANVIKRGAGRAAHSERTNRHAQRTALPPRPGQVEAAKETPAEEYHRLTALPPSAQAKPSVRKRIQELGNLPENTGERPESHGEATTADTCSPAKAQAFAEKAEAAGWKVAIGLMAGATELVATRGAETIVQAWRAGVWQYDASVYAFADRTTKPRNASGAVKLLSRPAETAEAETQKVNSNTHFRKREPKELKTLVLPLDPELLTAEEATKYFRGRTVRWYNRQTRGTETATVGRNQPVRVTRHAGEVTVSFCCPVTGFRAFHLSAILAIGRGHSAVTKGSEFAVVELEQAEAA